MVAKWRDEYPRYHFYRIYSRFRQVISMHMVERRNVVETQNKRRKAGTTRHAFPHCVKCDDLVVECRVDSPPGGLSTTASVTFVVPVAVGAVLTPLPSQRPPTPLPHIQADTHWPAPATPLRMVPIVSWIVISFPRFSSGFCSPI